MNKDNASFAAGLLLALALEMATAGPPILIDRQTGKYLGNLSSNPHDPDSTNNPYAANPPAIVTSPPSGAEMQPPQ